MTDEEYVYRSDIKEKSRIARSAKNAYSARRRKCRLPADTMTKKELANMNGKVYTVKLGEPIA